MSRKNQRSDALSVMTVSGSVEMHTNWQKRILMNTLQEFVVDKTSGTIDGYPNFGLGLDHFQINKFPAPENVYYRRVVRELGSLYEKHKSKCTALNRFAGERAVVPFEAACVPISAGQQRLPESSGKEPTRTALSTRDRGTSVYRQATDFF